MGSWKSGRIFNEPGTPNDSSFDPTFQAMMGNVESGGSSHQHTQSLESQGHLYAAWAVIILHLQNKK